MEIVGFYANVGTCCTWSTRADLKVHVSVVVAHVFLQLLLVL